MNGPIWKIVVVLFTAMFFYDLYDFIKLSNLDLIDTPNWLNIGNLISGALLVLCLSSYAFERSFISSAICYVVIVLNATFLVLTHYYEFSLGGYEGAEMLFVAMINFFVLVIISSALLKHAKELNDSRSDEALK